MSSPATLIATDAYPQLPRVPAIALRKALRCPKVAQAAKTALQVSEDAMRPAVLGVIAELSGAVGNPGQLFAYAHEIRGLAGNAGLPAVGKIASLLCRYLDHVARANGLPDEAVCHLHIMALTRAAQENGDSDDAQEAVLQGLTALVARKITETGEVTSSFSAR